MFRKIVKTLCTKSVSVLEVFLLKLKSYMQYRPTTKLMICNYVFRYRSRKFVQETLQKFIILLFFSTRHTKIFRTLYLRISFPLVVCFHEQICLHSLFIFTRLMIMSSYATVPKDRIIFIPNNHWIDIHLSVPNVPSLTMPNQ
jgi:hypothetical protein